MARDVDSSHSDDPSTEQAERAQGSFEIRILAAPVDERDFRSLRRALGMSRADVPWLRAHIPGVVRRGAESDLRSVLSRLREAGHSAELRRRPGRDADS